VLGHFASGVSIATAICEEKPVGLTIQSFTSLSLDPPLILLSPARSSTTWPLIRRAGRLCVNILAEGQADLARQFARSGIDKYAGVSWKPAPSTQSPLFPDALAWIDCEIEHEYEGGDHFVVICRVLDLGAEHPGRPLVFFQSGFQRLVDPGMTAFGDVRSVVLSVADMEASCQFYGERLGLELLFRDGDRWALYGGGDFNLALAGPGQALPDPMAVNIKVADVAAALRTLAEAGVQVVEPITFAEHEVRGAFRDPDGHLFYVYSPRNGS
jgi:3-hydroxy-9,10-secoandrosta-1,3,5(10)-triene-9,17-dione monooxygenase reductase component